MSKENKVYQIETVQDIVNCTNPDNIDAFLDDLRYVLNSLHLIRVTHKYVTDVPFEVPKSFQWTDDGINEVSLDLRVKETGETIGTLKTTPTHD